MMQMHQCPSCKMLTPLVVLLKVMRPRLSFPSIRSKMPLMFTRSSRKLLLDSLVNSINIFPQILYLPMICCKDRDSYMDSDQTLPKELTVMFQPLFCKLCNMQLSSSVVAKLHYNGKNHEKKVRKYLIEHSERTGEPLHKRARPESKKTENPVSIAVLRRFY